jgi:hypothetical protein
MTAPRFEKTGEADGKIIIGGVCVAEIAAMALKNLRLGRDGGTIIGSDVPLPLYWRQYAHHEDPRRNGGINPRVNQVEGNEGEIFIRCEGTNSEGEIISLVTLGIAEDRPEGGYAVEIRGFLEVAPGKTWNVTYNPGHGEIEFCNIWPEGTFRTRGKKSFSHCFVQRGGAVTLIPHTHIESSDKQNILMHPGDRFGWLLENENPVVELIAGGEASTGLCAYMWDAHFGYRACPDGKSVSLEAGTRYESAIRIRGLGRAEGKALMARGVEADPGDSALTPLYVDGINTFRETLKSLPGKEQSVWPWAFEVTAGEPHRTEGSVDRSNGCDDACSLRIRAGAEGGGRWIATTLGPAFGGPPFSGGKRYTLSAMACSSALKGSARAGLRLHREGRPGLGHTQTYETYWTEKRISGDTPWTRLDVTTPAISPPPDRVHLVLDQEGEGSSWFDNVLFESHE